MNDSLPIAVLGFGVTGQSVARYLLAQQRRVVVLDTRASFLDEVDPELVEFAGADFMWQVMGWPDLDVEYAVVSPGLSMDSCLVRSARTRGVILKSDIDLFIAEARAPVIGVTGTNGKSTVTELVGHIIQHSGLACGVGGNLGEAALGLLDPETAFYVLELSSFQLERSGELPLAAAVVLNVTQDHLDEHGDMASYAAAKKRIFTRADRCVFNRDDQTTKPDARAEDEVVSFGLDEPLRSNDWGVASHAGEEWLYCGSEKIIAVTDLPLEGGHNVANVLAACALAEGLVERDTLPAAIRSFSGLPHRFVEVASIGGVTYVNDSKATNVGATVAALEGLPAQNQIVLVGGGDAKGADLSPLAAVFQDRVRHVFTLGKDGDALASVAQAAGIGTTACTDVVDAVGRAAARAVAGDMVLLSPACSSLDMYESYAERGNQFADAVAALLVEAGGVETGGAET